MKRATPILTRPAVAAARPREPAVLSKHVAILLYLTLGAFYAANLYSSSAQVALGIVKWVPLAFLFVTAILAAPIQRFARNGALLAALLLAVGVSVFAADDEVHSAEYFLSLALVLGAAWSLTALLNTSSRRLAFITILENVGLLVFLSAAACRVLGINLGRGLGRFSAWTDNPNTLGMLLAPFCVILVARILNPGDRIRIRDVILAVGAAYLIFETGSRASMLWVLAAFLVFIVARRGISLGLAVAAFTVFATAAWSDELRQLMLDYWRYRAPTYIAPGQVDLLSGRDELWSLGMSLWVQRPWLGYGPGSAADLIERNASLLTISQGLHFHNSYLSALVESGLVGLFSLTVALGASIYSAGRRLAPIAGTPRIASVWTTQVLPLALVVGACAHAFFETWLLNGGNANALAMWTLVWLLMVPDRRTAAIRAVSRHGPIFSRASA